ncbi:MAG TPA: hypothetical protein PKZ32_22900, partial [Candidatus Melainabacteria bacterium]|nr:hypothetical protein [Candidatus Melainabacteria bacterium]
MDTARILIVEESAMLRQHSLNMVEEIGLVAQAVADIEEALKRLYPAHRRTREDLHALAGVNADGHKFDVFVKWDDGTVGRPIAGAAVRIADDG